MKRIWEIQPQLVVADPEILKKWMYDRLEESPAVAVGQKIYLIDFDIDEKNCSASFEMIIMGIHTEKIESATSVSGLKIYQHKDTGEYEPIIVDTKTHSLLDVKFSEVV